MSTLATLQSLIALGESETLELKRSTAELKRAGETLCAFLNGDGGQVLVGVGPKGQLVDQQVADITLRDIAATLGKIEPAARIELDRVALENGIDRCLSDRLGSLGRSQCPSIRGLRTDLVPSRGAAPMPGSHGRR